MLKSNAQGENRRAAQRASRMAYRSGAAPPGFNSRGGQGTMRQSPVRQVSSRIQRRTCCRCRCWRPRQRGPPVRAFCALPKATSRSPHPPAQEAGTSYLASSESGHVPRQSRLSMRYLGHRRTGLGTLRASRPRQRSFPCARYLV